MNYRLKIGLDPPAAPPRWVIDPEKQNGAWWTADPEKARRFASVAEALTWAAERAALADYFELRPEEASP